MPCEKPDTEAEYHVIQIQNTILTEAEYHVMTEAEIGVTLPGAKECQGLQTAARN